LRNVVHAIVAILSIATVTGCASTATRPTRPATSSYGCMQSVTREKLPANLPDARAHCLAAGLIARYCSSSEAYLAGIGKELRDLLGPGDAEWKDWRADRVGIDCARHAEGDDELDSCCSSRGY
jgi:hypothetical protein